MIIRWKTEIPSDNSWKFVKLSKMVPELEEDEPRYDIRYFKDGCWRDVDGNRLTDVIAWADLTEEEPVEVAYLCDHEKECSNRPGGCMTKLFPNCCHTTDIEHAINFKKVSADGAGKFMEVRDV